MRFSFSSEYLKILPPAMNFGEAWENLCLCLLRAETGDTSMIRLGPPDRGIDIYRQVARLAYQCKSSERGVFGTINPQDCIASLATALEAKKDIIWNHYYVAVNAPLSGVGFSKIVEFARAEGLAEDALSILAPEYWNDLCERHTAAIRYLFDYRVFVSEAEVVEALRKARYYDNIVQQALADRAASPLDVVVTNNRTATELVLPVSEHLTIEQILDVTQQILGISLDPTEYPELGTSCRPALSMTVDRKRLDFNRKISELTEEERAKLQLWIKLLWRDETKAIQGDEHDRLSRFSLELLDTQFESTEDRGKATLARTLAAIQNRMWQSLERRATR